jgi:hypothetical protein
MNPDCTEICGADSPPPSKRRGHERVELYIYSPSGPSWPVIGRTLPFFFFTEICQTTEESALRALVR